MKTHHAQGAASWRRTTGLLLLALAFWTVSPADAAPPAINKRCPVMTEEEVDPKITASYQGRTVAFCCDRCRAKFKADPEKYAGRLPQLADATTPGDPLTVETEGDDPVETAHNVAVTGDTTSFFPVFSVPQQPVAKVGCTHGL